MVLFVILGQCNLMRNYRHSEINVCKYFISNMMTSKVLALQSIRNTAKKMDVTIRILQGFTQLLINALFYFATRNGLYTRVYFLSDRLSLLLINQEVPCSILRSAKGFFSSGLPHGMY